MSTLIFLSLFWAGSPPPPIMSSHTWMSFWQDGGSNAEYMRFKQEIIESQVFDRLKFELGMKNFTKLVREKLIPIPLDLVSPYRSIPSHHSDLLFIEHRATSS